MEDLTTGRPPGIAAALAAKHAAPEDVFDHFGDGADLIVGLGNGEPVTIIDALEEGGRKALGRHDSSDVSPARTPLHAR